VQAKESREVDVVPSEAEQLREQRDRFLAFAFAASDLLLEIGDDSMIRYAVGATNQLLGGPPASVIGQGWLDLFVAEDRPLLSPRSAPWCRANAAAPSWSRSSPRRRPRFLPRPLPRPLPGLRHSPAALRQKGRAGRCR
jgi:PAS domain-containing protein